MNRRSFFRTAAAAIPAAGFAATCYGFYEAGAVTVDRQTFALPGLPAAFRNTTVAFLTDLHHGPYVDLDFVAAVVRTTNLLRPDLILLGGDYSLRDGKYIAPCFDLLAGLHAPMGVAGVLGNHDYWHGLNETRAAMKDAKIAELTNAGFWLERRGERFRIAGVDDLWCGTPDARTALGDCRKNESCLLVSHNPDYAEQIDGGPIGLVLSGHTHGGQVAFPGFGAPWAPSRFGQKYLRGRVDAPNTQVFVSRGLGLAAVPVRIGSRPEINLITLV
jgi:uncharacterized protein